MAPIVLQDVEEEYKKNPELNKDDVQHLMEWIQKQPHLPKISELQAILFFHSCIYKTEFTKSVIDLNYSMRTHVDAIFKNRDPLEKKVQHTLESVLFAALPIDEATGHRTMYCRLLDYEPKNFLFPSAIKVFCLAFDLMQWEEGTWNGFILVIDMDRVVLGHLARLEILMIKQVLMYLQDAMPTRLKSVHFMNCPHFMDKLMAMLRPFIKKELMNMLFLHPKPVDSIYAHIPKKSFPKEAGGDYYEFEKIKENLKKHLLENREMLMDEEVLRVDEALRPGKPKDMGSIFGVEGSFKKLDID